MDITRYSDEQSPIVIAAVGDLHVNSTVGLSPPKIRLDDGGWYSQSEFQKKLWECWIDFWCQFEHDGIGAHKVVVLNGDLVDGDHHNTSQIVTRNQEIQHQMALLTLEKPRELADEIFVVRGTDVHVGEAARSEEAIGRDLDAVRSLDLRHSHWRLRANFGGVGFDFAHHGSMGRLPWTSANLLLRTAVEVELEYYRSGERPPAYAVRSHNHQWGDTSMNSPVRVLALGCWQGLTSFVNRIKPGATPHIGGIIFRIEAGQASFRIVNYTKQSWII